MGNQGQCSGEDGQGFRKRSGGSAGVRSLSFLGAEVQILLQVCQGEAAGPRRRPARCRGCHASLTLPTATQHFWSWPSAGAGEAHRQWGLVPAPRGLLPTPRPPLIPKDSQTCVFIRVNTLGPSPGPPPPCLIGWQMDFWGAPAVQNLWLRRSERKAAHR